MTAYTFPNKSSAPTYTSPSKHTTSYSSPSKNVTSYTFPSKNTTSYTDTPKTGVAATAGLYMGFGAFTYSGGQNLGIYNPNYTYPVKN